LARAGLGTKYVDGDTRLRTATASFALRETFGDDGNPASVTDYDVADCIAHFGHNIANTQTVAWAPILDRRRGRTRPALHRSVDSLDEQSRRTAITPRNLPEILRPSNPRLKSRNTL
jgi:anaerobic selenocysteine-containing dehydrogenase